MSSLLARQNIQSGAALIVTLIMMVMITLFAITAIRSSTTELQIVGNMQMRKELAAAAQEGIENVITSMTVFNNLILGGTPIPQTIGVQGGRYTVTVSSPVCLKSAPTKGGSLVNPGVTSTETTYWEVVATVLDNDSGARMTTTQGIKMRMPINSCP